MSIRENIRWTKIIAPHLRSYVIAKGSNKTRIWMQIAMLLGLGIAVLGLAAPTWKKIEIPGQKLETPMIVILDLSESMLSDDIQPNRLERSKLKIKDLIKHRPQARMALVGFAGTAHTIVHLTKDYSIIESHIESLSPKTMPYGGSNLKAALTLADTLTQVTDAPGTIVIFSDDLSDTEIMTLNTFKRNSKNKLCIVPMNTPDGALMPDKSRSKLDEIVLSKLNSIEGITVQKPTIDDSDMEHIAKEISNNLMFTEKTQEKEDDWNDYGLLFVIPATFIFLLWFRKGWVLYAIVLPLTLSSCNKNDKFIDLWYTRDYQGQLFSDRGDYELAAKTYSSAMRKGIAYFKAGNYDKATDAFMQDTTAQGAYNLGVAYAKNGKLNAARYAFDEAIEKDPALEAAKENIQLINRILPNSDSMSLETAEESDGSSPDNNIQNKGEDLGGGGQEATKEDAEKQRAEENVASNIHMGKELDEVPDEMQVSKQRDKNMMMRKVDDDPALFLQRKFRYQVKKEHLTPPTDAKKW
ncbi:MAG: VWA domain-containing protein [Bacteroidales bacterium]